MVKVTVANKSRVAAKNAQNTINLLKYCVFINSFCFGVNSSIMKRAPIFIIIITTPIKYLFSAIFSKVLIIYI